MTNYAKHLSVKETPQNEKIFGSNQIQNNAGGFSFQVDDWKRLNRFLILGTQGGSYYASEHKLTVANADGVIRCINADGVRVVNTVIEISNNGRAPKNDPAIFVLALVTKYGNDASRKAAYDNLSKVCRISTHLFQFLNFSEQIGKGYGSGFLRSVSNWYNDKELNDLASQVTKYRNREGYSHRDVLRLSHVKTNDSARNEIYKWISWNGYKNGKDAPVSFKSEKQKELYLKNHETIVSWVKSHYNETGEMISNVHPLIDVFERIQRAKKASEIVSLIKEHKLPREVIPTELLNDVSVWEALLPHMPMTAMIRNLATMTTVGLIKPLSDASKLVISKLDNVEALRKARVHPIQVLSAMNVYGGGHGFRSTKTWTPDQNIVDALDSAFYASFGNVEPTGKNIMLALDISGSMEGGEIAGVPGITPRVGSAAMAMVTAHVEKNVLITGFHNTLIELNISGKKRLDEVVRYINGLGFGGTDCSLPMTYASKNKLKVDGFVVYTDSETWAGNIHPSQALVKYRKDSGISAKSVVVGMVANEFSIADPNDVGMMDVVGFDTATPQLISEFIKE